ncbi:hypothetical protein ILP92_11600 [Maribius pontilimi]|uniref:Uncharacterized protein n=1 Tax=Palleronia pontilimi TaxID=1964209 RepID=A0A934IHB8_9RHOB|nr:hypothetical protein [Palleronia pontilimi]MBJ3763390.1 hypothetical protein [Palleronia pontilimi]
MFTARNVIVAAIAGILGCIANSIAITVMAGAELMPLILSAGREFWSVVFALALIPIFARMSGAAAWITGFVVLNALASLSAKLIWGAGAPWSFVLTVNGAYAIVAVAVYAVGREKAVR